MKSGLLWYDAHTDKSIIDKIHEASDRYFERFGMRPTVCYVNPKAMPADPPVLDGLTLKSAPTILPNHLWLGVE